VPLSEARVARSPNAFTLIELMVVIGIIVIALALAVPSFSFITSARSVEAAQNVVAATLGRARTEAVNTGTYVGVFFFLDPKTDRTTLALATLDGGELDDSDPYDNIKSWNPTFSYRGTDTASVGPPALTADRVIFSTRDNTLDNPATANINEAMNNRPMVKTYRAKVSGAPGVSPPTTGPQTSGIWAGKFENANWEEYLPGNLEQSSVIDFSVLPTGVGAQLIYDAGGSTASDRYVRTGLILFDPQGRLVYKKYSIKASTDLGRNMNLTSTFPGGTTTIYSSFGLVLYDRATFINQPNFTEGDFNQPLSTLTGPSGYVSDEQTEEAWLDTNATPILVNRYSGTLMTGAQP